MHKAKAVIVSCMDFRFHDELQHWLEDKKYLGLTDEITVAGASRDIVAPKEEFHKEYLMRQIDLSVKLHDPDEIIICDHEDCGGYKDLIPDGTSPEDDKKKHKKYLEKSKQILQKLYPEKKIRKIYITLQKDFIEFK